MKERFGYGLAALLACLVLASGCKTIDSISTIMEKCAEPINYYRMSLKAGDVVNVTLASTVNVKTMNGTDVNIPADNIDRLSFGEIAQVNVTFCDRNRIKGAILNKTLRVRLEFTGKLEDIEVNRIKSLTNIGQKPPVMDIDRPAAPSARPSRSSGK